MPLPRANWKGRGLFVGKKLYNVSFGKRNSNFRTFSQCTLEADFGMMELCGMFHNGKPQPCAANLFGMAFVYPVEALKNPGLLFVRNPNAIVADRQIYSIFII